MNCASVFRYLMGCTLLFLSTSTWAEEDKVCFYEHKDWTGNEWCYTSDASQVMGNDQFSSMRIFGNAYAEAYEHGNYAGRKLVLMQDVYVFKRLNDAISSVKIKLRNSDDFACFFQDAGFHGTPYCAEAGQAVEDLNVADLRNEFSSVFVSGNARVEIFSYPNLSPSNPHASLTHTWSNLNDTGYGEYPYGRNWNDDVDSFRVLHHEPTDSLTRAIAAQEKLGAASPFYRTTWMGTHNSYNSNDYLGTFSGENHNIGIGEQLALGARMLELDIHYSDATLCHTPDCLLASADVSFKRVLAEIKTWAQSADGDDFLLVKVEDHISGGVDGYLSVKRKIEEVLGDYLYRPSAGSGRCEYQQLPSVQDIVRTGARVMFFSWGCNSDAIAAGMDEVWFKRGGPEPSYSHDYRSSCPDSLPGSFGEISISTEDQRKIIGHALPDNQVRAALDCGLNTIGEDDFQYKYTGRWWEYMWAWPNGVSGGHLDCAAYSQPDNGFVPVACDTTQQFICRKGDGSLAVTSSASGSGQWSAGQAACSVEFAGSSFSLPTNAYEAKQLRDLQQSTGASRAWANYRKVGNDWLPDMERQFFSLYNPGVDGCLAVGDSSISDGTNISHRRCDRSDGQLWYYDHASAMFYSKLNPNYCLDSTGSGSNIQLWKCDSSSAGQKFDWVGEMIRVRSNSSQVVDASTGDVGRREYHGGANQQWRKIFGAPVSLNNLALGKSTSQSSTAWGGVSARAVDGDTDGDYSNYSVTHTSSDNQSWWQVDLGASYRLDSINLFNRTDCCSDRLAGFYVLISDQPFGDRSLTELLADSSVWRQYHSTIVDGREGFYVNTDGRYIRIQLDHSGIASLAELEVIGH